jgi:hypothetical protein
MKSVSAERKGNSRGALSSSFLVRVWREHREGDWEEKPVRVYLRNLRTGEEQYLKDPLQVGEWITRELESKREVQGEAEREVL